MPPPVPAASHALRVLLRARPSLAASGVFHRCSRSLLSQEDAGQGGGFAKATPVVPSRPYSSLLTPPFSFSSILGRIRGKGKEGLPSLSAKEGLRRDLDAVCREVRDLPAGAEVDAVMEKYRERIGVIELRGYTVLLTCLGREGHSKKAHKVYCWMLREGIKPNVFTYNAVISALARSKDTQIAINVFDEMNAAGVAPNCHVYSSLLSACERGGRWDKAIEVFSELETKALTDSSLQPNSYTFGAMLSALMKTVPPKWELALEYHKKMAAAGVRRNLYSYSAVINSCERAGQWEAAVEVFEEMKADGISPDMITFHSVALAYAQGGRLDMVFRTFMEIVDSGVPPDRSAFHALILACERCGQAGTGFQVLDQMSRAGVDPDASTFNLLIGVCDRQGLNDKAMEMLVKMTAQGLRPEVGTYNSIMLAFEHNNHDAGILEVFRGMAAAEVKPDSQTYHLVLGGLSKMGYVGHALRLINDMVADGLTPDSRMIMLGIMTCAKQGQTGIAFRFFEEMRKVPGAETNNVYVYNALISCCEKSRDLARAGRVFEMMRRGGVKPDACSYSSIISACNKTGDWAQAMKYSRDMAERKVPGNTITYNTLISAADKAGDVEEAVAILRRMEAHGIAADAFTYSSLLSACAHAGEWRRAKELYEEYKRKGLPPDEIVYNIAIQALWTTDPSSEGKARASLALDVFEEGRVSGFFADATRHGTRWTIDLHRMSPAAAQVAVVRWYVRSLLPAARDGGLSPQLVIVTGRGKHSRGPVSPVKSGIEGLVSLLGLPFQQHPLNPGCLMCSARDFHTHAQQVSGGATGVGARLGVVAAAADGARARAAAAGDG